MVKKIVIFSDGTGQMGGEQHNSNVYKLFNMVESRTQNQVVYYDPGLGTDLYRITGLVFGRGISKNIKYCYRFLFQHYESGDKIFLFGFSRGAATVRSLSGFLHMFGILPNSREDLVDKAFSIYRITDKDRRKQKAEEFIAKHHNHWCNVEFLGVWDTVASLGIPIPYFNFIIDRFFPHKFHNFDLSESVKYARHAISVDEERSVYKPVLWNKLKEEPDGRLKQVWFCGVHSDVGGGYEQEKESDLSNIALIWMMSEAIEKGLLIYKDCAFLKLLQQLMPNPDGYMHDEQLTYPGKLFGRITRTWDPQIHGDLVIHESVFSRKKGRNNLDDPKYEPWILKMSPHKIEPWKKKFALEERVYTEWERRPPTI